MGIIEKGDKMTIGNKYKHYKSLPGYLSLIADGSLAVGVMMLFINWLLSIPLFITTIILWFVARNIHKKEVVAPSAATHKEATEISREKKKEKERDMKSRENRVADLTKRMSEGVLMVKLGLYVRLTNSLKDTYEIERAKRLATAVVNELFSDSPVSAKGKIFLESSRTLIEQIISGLRDNKETCEAVTQAVRVKGIMNDTADGDTQKVLPPLEKLRQFGILVPGRKIPKPDSFLSMAREFEGLK